MGYTLRRLMAGRLLGMAVEGVGTWFLLMIGGVPMAALLGLLTGLLAFLPNIGAIISGVLIVLVGFSVGVETGLWAIAVYVIVQIVDGYLIVPYVARKTVDLAPALVLGAQLIFGALFGILGLALADPIVAMIKAALEQKSIDDEAEADAPARRAGAAERLAPADAGDARADVSGRRGRARPAARSPAAAGGAASPCGARRRAAARLACSAAGSCRPAAPIICCIAAMPGATWSTSISNTSVSLGVNGAPGGSGPWTCVPGGSQSR